MTARSFGLWWGTIEGAGIAALAEVAGAAGFGSISVTPAMYFEARAQGSSDDQVRALLTRADVTAAMIDPLIHGLPGAPDPASMAPRFRATFEHGPEDVFRAAEALGARSINIAHYMGAPTPRGQLIDAIGVIGRDAADRGLQVVVEFMPEGSIRDLSDAAAIVAGVAAPNVAIMLDTWHFWRTAGQLADLEQLPLGAIGAVQVGDAPEAAWGTGVNPPSPDRLLPGHGAVPLREIVAIARHNNPDVVVGIEVFNRASIEGAPLDRAAAAAVAMVGALG
jgi:sugar phosphate isomerase/epimerase